VTISGELFETHRAQAIDADADTWRPAIRATAYPSVKLGERWYFYSALQLSGGPFSYYDSFYPENETEHHIVQAFLAYRWAGERNAVSVKVGQLSAAFGAFPMRYDEASNPLLDEPLAYSNLLVIRPDALPCGVKDLPNLRYYAEYVGVHFYCGGPETMTHGVQPVTLYGLPGVEIDLSLHNLDARFQLTNSSPSNPQSLGSDSQHAQWTAGAGWTIRQGFRVGMSAMRGPFMESNLKSLLPSGKTVRDYSANAVGADAQWARGRFSLNGEWYRAQFPYPRLLIPVTVNSGYAEVKAILTPRIYAAFRGSWQIHNRVEDSKGRSPLPFQPNVAAYEFALGYRPNHWQLVKLGYEWRRTDGVTGTRNNVLGIQLVTSFNALSNAIR
jgi:hypothetical protein